MKNSFGAIRNKELFQQVRSGLEHISRHRELLDAALANMKLELPDFSEVAEAFKKFDEDFPLIVETLAMNGWFISSWHTALSSLRTMHSHFVNEDKDIGNQLMVRHFQHIYEDIKKDLLNNNSDRSEVLNAAFKAHERGNYILSIPVFLALHTLRMTESCRNRAYK